MFEPLHGRKLMLCDVIYQRPSKQSNFKTDYITMVYRDLITGEKNLFTIKNPTYVVYVLKEQYRNFDADNPRHSALLEQCDPHEIRYNDRFRFIAEQSNQMDFLRTHRGSELRELYRYSYIFGADIPIEVYYRYLWKRELDNDLPKRPTRCFLDIEVDTSEWEGADPVPKDGECPINAIAVVDVETMYCCQFLLKEKNNPQIDEFLERMAQGCSQAAIDAAPDDMKPGKNNPLTPREQFHKMFDEYYHNPTWKVFMFEDEVELIRQCFNYIHSIKRDFCGIFNMDFDIPYIEHRLENLGVDPKSIFCHPDFPEQTYYYNRDSHQFDFEKRRSFCECSAYTHFMDVMYLYVGSRRSRGAVREINLNAIAEHELGDTKLDYSEVTSIKWFSRTDYILFILYGMKDSLLLGALDNRTRDLETFYNSCLTSLCQYKDGLKQTISMRSDFYEGFLEEYEILGHSCAPDEDEYTLSESDEDWGDCYDDDDEDGDKKYDGGFVATPLNNAANGLNMYGVPSRWMFGLTADEDFSGMYPTNMCAYNMFAVCMYGKLYIDNATNRLHYSEDAGTEFSDDVIGDNYQHFAHKWLDIPSFEELNDIVTSEMGLRKVG